MGENGQFHLAEVIIREQKYFDVSLEEMLREHARNRKFEVSTTAEAFDSGINEAVEVYLVLKVSGRLEYSISWDIALLLHNERIDGFGFEALWIGHRGDECSGWHRHIWNPRQGHAKRKDPVACFGSANTFQHFVTTSLKQMNIVLNGRDDGSPNLF